MQLTMLLWRIQSALTLIKSKGSVNLVSGTKKVLQDCYGRSSNTGHIITIIQTMLYLFAQEALSGNVILFDNKLVV